jgi:ABC-2 type transport system permease protein
MKLKINFKNIWIIAKKELFSYLDNPASYVVLIVFLLLWFFMFFRSVFVVGEASLSSLFDIYPWFGLIFLSAITMSTISKERDDSTLEFVLTHPIREVEFILGKLVSCVIFVLFTLLFTIPVAVLFSLNASFDWGVYASQMLSAILFSISLISVGIFLSSLFSSQIAALLSTLGFGFLLIVSGSDIVTASVPSIVIPVLEKISLLTHYSSLARGVIDLYDVLYFVMFIIIFTLLTLLQLYKRKYGDYKARYSILQFITAGLVLSLFVAGMLKIWIPFRLDVTQNRAFTLSPKSKQILKTLPGPIKITVYSSKQLPSQYLPVLRDLKFVLNDYKLAAGNKIELSYIDPSVNVDEEKKAVEQGIQKMQFNVIGKEELQLKAGFLGILIKYNDQTEPIAFVQSTADIEYQLTSLIRKLTATDKKSVQILAGHGEKGPSDYAYFAGELQRTFNVTVTTLDSKTNFVDPSINTLIISAPTQDYSDDIISSFKDLVAEGKNLVIFADGYKISNTLQAAATTNNLNKLLSSFGVTINNDIAYDLTSFENISFAQGNQRLAAAYPYWIVSNIQENTPLDLKQVKDTTLFWADTITVDDQVLANAGYTRKDVLLTSNNAGSVAGVKDVYPMAQIPAAKSGRKLLGLVLVPNDSNKGRIVVMGDADFVSDSFIQRSPQNMALGVGLVSWASNTDNLSDIQVKHNVFSLFKFKNTNQSTQIKFGMLGLVVIAPIVIGVVRYVRRKTLRYQAVRI